MKIVIDARMWNESGIGRYLRNLIDQLQKLDHQNKYFILLLVKDFNTLNFKNNFKKIRADFRWYTLAEQTKLPEILNKLDPDLVHFPHFNVPIFYKGKYVVTIHDLIHQHFNFQRASTHGYLTYKLKQFGYKKVFGTAIKKSAKILTPSSFVKSQLINEWQVDKDKIVVTTEGVDDIISAIAKKINQDRVDQIMKRFNIDTPYLFYVGAAHPHKNIKGLINAFLILRRDYQYLKLVLSGMDNYFWQRVKNEYQHKDIVYTGQVSDDELVALYKNAEVFVMPSFEEGFGIPILEAMALGCPVVSSNSGSLPEVGGEAAVYFNPLDTADMSSKITHVLKSKKLRKELIEKGKKRVEDFSWRKLAEQTLEVYQNASSISA